MSTKCSGCNKPIQSLDFLECSACQDIYDLLCLGLCQEAFASMTQESRDSWICPLCTNAKPKSDNTNIPIGSPANPLNSTYNTSDHANTTLDRVNNLRGGRRQLAPPASCCSTEAKIEMLVTEVQYLREEMREVKEQNISMKEQLVSLTAVKMKAYEDKIADQDATIVELKTQLNLQEQNQLRNELEIAGVPEADSENLQHVALVMASRLGVQLVAEDLDSVTRVGTKRPPAITNKDWMPRPIVVKLLRRTKRDELLLAAKSRRNLTSDIVAQGTSRKLYINERLTKANRSLFKEARQRAHQYNFRFCWVRNGSIYVRQSEKKPALLIMSVLDLDQRVGPSKDKDQETRNPIDKAL